MRLSILLSLTSLMSFSSIASIEITDNLSLSGFASTSISRSNNDTALIINRGIADDTCYDCDTTLGLQLDYYNEAFKASAQLVKRPQDGWGDPELEWAYVGYTVDNIEFRAGRLRLPLFLTSEYYYVSHAYTNARPPEELYNSILGITAYNGANIVWNIELFDEYQLSITPFVGFSDSNHLDVSDTLEVDIEIDKLSGINFLFTGDYYRWNFSYFNADFGQNLQFTNAIPNVPYFEIDLPDENVELYSIGAEYEFGAMSIASEFQFNNIRDSWYTSASYKMGKFIPYVVYGENHSKITNVSTFKGLTGTSKLIGVRYNVKYNLSLNVEWQQFKTYGGQRGSFVGTPTQTDANLGSIMLNYVF